MGTCAIPSGKKGDGPKENKSSKTNNKRKIIGRVHV